MKQGRIMIDRERCKGCGLCVRACPVGVIALDERINAAGVYPARDAKPEACVACGSCYLVCPDTAIEVFELEGATGG